MALDEKGKSEDCRLKGHGRKKDGMPLNREVRISVGRRGNARWPESREKPLGGIRNGGDVKKDSSTAPAGGKQRSTKKSDDGIHKKEK